MGSFISAGGGATTSGGVVNEGGGRSRLLVAEASLAVLTSQAGFFAGLARSPPIDFLFPPATFSECTISCCGLSVDEEPVAAE